MLSMLGKRLNNAGLLFMGKQSRMGFLVEGCCVLIFSFFGQHRCCSGLFLEFSDKAYLLCK